MSAMRGIGVGEPTKIVNTSCDKLQQENYEIILLCDDARDDYVLPSNR